MKERKTVYRWWWVWDYEKEEQWLNEMAMSGWVLERVEFITYHFVYIENNDYVIHLDMLRHDGDYEQFMAEIGAEYIGHVVGWVYYRQKLSVGGSAAPANIDLRIEQLERISKMLLIIGLVNILIGVANTINVTRLGIVNLLCGCLLMYALGRIHGKEDELKKQRAIHE